MMRAALPEAEILRVENLVKHFPVTRGIVFKRRIGTVKAVDGISFMVGSGETLGLVGEMCCGRAGAR
jgi:ABC-type oligopeptide transport system ATPase subunit